MATSLYRMAKVAEPPRSGAGPATFGQRMMWHWVELIAPATEIFNIVQGAPVPVGLGVDDVVAAIGEIVGRHDALRTRYRVDGGLVQELSEEVELPVEIVAAEDGGNLDRLAEGIVRRLGATRFDPAAGWPLRAVVATVAGTPLGVVFVFSHLAVDMLSARTLLGEFAGLLAASAAGRPWPLPRPYRRSLEQAAYEASERGRREAERSLAYWRRQFETVPRTMFATDPLPPDAAGRYRRGSLTSRALGPAAGVLARRYGVGTSTVFLAATAVVLARLGGLPRCSLRLHSGNRAARDLRHAVGVLSQDVPVTIDVSGLEFGDVVRSAWAASVRAYRHSLYDWRRVEELLAEMRYRRGADLDISYFFNDLRPDLRATPAAGAIADARVIADARAMAAGPGTIRAAAAESAFGWEESWPSDSRTVLVHLHGGVDGAPTVLSVSVDTCVLTSAQGRALAEGVERLLVEAVNEEPFAPGAASPGGVYVDGCRVDPIAVRRLLCDAVAPHVAEALIEPGPGGEAELVGRLVPREPDLTPEDVHSACLALLPGRPTAMAPQRYVLCADDGRVLHAGTGRS